MLCIMLKQLYEKKENVENRIYGMTHNPSSCGITNPEQLKTEINNCKNQLVRLKNQIYYMCQHEWIEDFIDISPEKSKKIIYCQSCLLTKREV